MKEEILTQRLVRILKAGKVLVLTVSLFFSSGKTWAQSSLETFFNTLKIGDQREVAISLQSGIDPESRKGDVSALAAATLAGQVEIMQLLLEAGANVNVRSGQNPALFYAATFDEEDEEEKKNRQRRMEEWDWPPGMGKPRMVSHLSGSRPWNSRSFEAVSDRSLPDDSTSRSTPPEDILADRSDSAQPTPSAFVDPQPPVSPEFTPTPSSEIGGRAGNLSSEPALGTSNIPVENTLSNRSDPVQPTPDREGLTSIDLPSPPTPITPPSVFNKTSGERTDVANTRLSSRNQPQPTTSRVSGTVRRTRIRGHLGRTTMGLILGGNWRQPSDDSRSSERVRRSNRSRRDRNEDNSETTSRRRKESSREDDEETTGGIVGALRGIVEESEVEPDPWDFESDEEEFWGDVWEFESESDDPVNDILEDGLPLPENLRPPIGLDADAEESETKNPDMGSNGDSTTFESDTASDESIDPELEGNTNSATATVDETPEPTSVATLEDDGDSDDFVPAINEPEPEDDSTLDVVLNTLGDWTGAFFDTIFSSDDDEASSSSSGSESSNSDAGTGIPSYVEVSETIDYRSGGNFRSRLTRIFTNLSTATT